MSGQMQSLDQVCGRKYSLLYMIWLLPLFLSLQGYRVLHRNLDKEHLFEPMSKKQSIKKKTMITKCWCWRYLLSKIQELHYIKILSFRFSNNFIIICLTCTHLSHPLVQKAKIREFHLTWLMQLHCTNWPI